MLSEIELVSRNESKNTLAKHMWIWSVFSVVIEFSKVQWILRHFFLRFLKKKNQFQSHSFIIQMLMAIRISHFEIRKLNGSFSFSMKESIYVEYYYPNILLHQIERVNFHSVSKLKFFHSVDKSFSFKRYLEIYIRNTWYIQWIL